MPALQVPPDFVGINYYHGYNVRDTSDNWLGFVEVDGPEAPRTKMNWAVRPEGLHRVLTQVHERYHLPALHYGERRLLRRPRGRGAVHDADRTAYLKSHMPPSSGKREEWPLRATSYGRCSTTSNGRTVIPSALHRLRRTLSPGAPRSDSGAGMGNWLALGASTGPGAVVSPSIEARTT